MLGQRQIAKAIDDYSIQARVATSTLQALEDSRIGIRPAEMSPIYQSSGRWETFVEVSVGRVWRLAWGMA
jgi:glycine betaine/choline ABC-type transport system substrate-binding protein